MLNDMFGEAGSFHVETVGDFDPDGFDHETHIDVYEEAGEVHVVADLPGVEKSDIDVTCDGQLVTIRADGERRSYDEQVRLPRPVDETSASATYNNGVLELTFEPASGGASIEIS